ncbi:MAG: hypothetical protein AAF497_22360 [Planctomycetota bacterium]
MNRIAACLFSIVLLCGFSGCEESEPPEPLHHVGTKEIPVVDVEAAASPDDFQLIQLKDGHDYWFYRDKSEQRGYAGLAHSPECQKCQAEKEKNQR